MKNRWAVGMTIYQMHCNSLPFDDRRLPKVKLNIVDKELEWPASCQKPPDMADIVARFLVKKPTGIDVSNFAVDFGDPSPTRYDCLTCDLFQSFSSLAISSLVNYVD